MFLNLGNLPQSSQSRPHGSGGGCGDSVGTTGHGALAGLAVPDADGLPLHGDLAAESAGVLGVLGDFHLLHLLTQGSTVTVDEFMSAVSFICG
jgi:hypothetical protein